MSDKKPAGQPALMSGLQKAVLWSLVLLLVASFTARAALLSSKPSNSGAAIEPSSYLASTKDGSSAAAHDESAGALEKALPYVTEGSLFGLIGFALGYATRKVFKLALLLIALGFIALQALVHFELLHVEWGSAVAWLNERILNLKESESVSSFLTKRIPSIGALLAGCGFGFLRG